MFTAFYTHLPPSSATPDTTQPTDTHAPDTSPHTAPQATHVHTRTQAATDATTSTVQDVQTGEPSQEAGGAGAAGTQQVLAHVSATELSELASQFAQGVSEDTVSMAAVQGYLMRHKRDPQGAVQGVSAWVASVQRCGSGSLSVEPAAEGQDLTL